MKFETPKTTIDTLILTSFDWNGVDDAHQEELVKELSSLLVEAALLRVLTDLDKDEQDSFLSLFKENLHETTLVSYVQEHFPTFGDMLVLEFDNFISSDDALAFQEQIYRSSSSL